MNRHNVIALFVVAAIVMLAACKKEDLSPLQSDSFLKLYGTEFVDQSAEVAQTADGGYIIAGTYASSATDNDMYLIKTDAFGNEQWHTLIGSTANDEVGIAVAVADDGYYMVGTLTDSLQRSDIYYTKVSNAGDTLWTRTYGGSENEVGADIVINDTLIGIVGSTTEANAQNGNPAGVQDMIALITGLDGEPRAEKVYGGTNDDYGSAIAALDGGVFALVGTTESLADKPELVNSANILVAKINRYGSELDRYTYGTSNDDFGTGLVVLPNEGLGVVGYTSVSGALSQVYFVKSGPELAVRDITVQYDRGDTTFIAEAIDATSDGGYIIAGSYDANDANKKDLLLMRLDATGTLLWRRTFGETEDDQATGVVQTADGGYALTGKTSFQGNTMLTLIKTNPDGTIGEETTE